MSHHIQIDFAKPVWYRISSVTKLGFVLMLFSALLLFILYDLIKIQESYKNTLQQSRIAITKTVLSKKTQMKQASILTADQQQLLTEMIAHLNVSWDRLYNALEQLNSPELALTSVLPNYQRQQLELQGEAKNMPAIFAYVESLEGLPEIEHVSLQKHQVDEEHPFQPVAFVILARWRQ